MDPNACWNEMSGFKWSESVQNLEDVHRLMELAEALLDWLQKGGYVPRITGNEDFDRFIAKSTCLAIIRS